MLNVALILDPWRDAHEVWISARTDQLGSATRADPCGGGKHTTPIVSVALK